MRQCGMKDVVICIECEGDRLYYDAETEDEAYEKFRPTFDVPRELLKFSRTTRDKVPADEIIL